MKTLKLLTTLVLMLFTLSSFADEKPFKAKKNNIKRSAAIVPVAPIVSGSPDEEGPVVLKDLLAYPASVPVAPMASGSPDEEAPAELKEMAAYPAAVPVAPMVLGNPDEEAPAGLQLISAYAVNK